MLVMVLFMCFAKSKLGYCGIRNENKQSLIIHEQLQQFQANLYRQALLGDEFFCLAINFLMNYYNVQQ